MITPGQPGDPPIPPHVPPELVRDFSFWSSPGMRPEPGGDPHAALGELLAGAPRIFYAPRNTPEGAGTWVLTRAEDMRAVLQDATTFSSNRKLFSPLVGEDWPLVPLEIDPPDHRRFRNLLNPLFAPKKMAELQVGIRQRAIRMIEELKPRGRCEYMADFAFPFAVSIFLQFLGLPEERRGEFLGWAEQMLHGPDGRTRSAGARAAVGFLRELIAKRRREPADDFVTMLIEARVDGRPLTDDEMVGMATLIFVAGLDTVAAALGFDMRYLACHPVEQERLRLDPALIPNAVEELLRAYPTVQMIRVARADTELCGARIKAGDRICCASMIANRDPHEFPDPDRIDLDRDANRHVAFAYGPHRCLGSHLARRELVIGLEEWLARIPRFRIRQGTSPTVHGGFVFGISDLELAWD